MVSSKAIALVNPSLIISLLLLLRVVVVDSFTFFQQQRLLPTNFNSRRHHYQQHQQQKSRRGQANQIMTKASLQDSTNDFTAVNNNSDGDEGGEGEGEERVVLPFPNLSIIGICGSIGSGKSYTCSLLVSKLNSLLSSPPSSSSLKHNDGCGDSGGDGDDTDDTDDNNNHKKEKIPGMEDQVAFHIDTDSLAHGVYEPGSLALTEIEHEFGKGVIRGDGTVDRKALGGIVFNDEAQMAVSNKCH